MLTPITRPLHPHVYASETPDHLALIMSDTGETISYGTLEDRSNQAAHLFREWGVPLGGVIAILADNHVCYSELCWGAKRSGLYYVPLSWHVTVAEAVYIVQDCEARILFFSPLFVAIAAAVAAATPGLKTVSLGAGKELSDYSAARDAMPTLRLPDERPGSDMLYTSGTTGRPKGVKRPLMPGAIDAAPYDYSLYESVGYGPDAVHFSPGPLYHASPLRTALMTQAFGGTVVVSPRFDAEDALKTVERFQVTHSNWVPTHFVRLLKLDRATRGAYDVSSLRLAMHGAAPCPIPVKEAMIAWFGPVFVEYYGGTEQFGGCSIDSFEWLAHKGSVGRPVISPVHILDDATGTEMPTGAIGTIYFENPPANDYHNAPGKMAAALSPQGWATFGDVGRLDDEGYLYLTDRRSNMIITGGVNVYPQEIEQRLIVHEQVADVAVFGVSDDEYGESVIAVVQPERWDDAGPALADALKAFCRVELSSIKCPKRIVFEPRLERGENGKLYKSELRQRYASSGTQLGR